MKILALGAWGTLRMETTTGISMSPLNLSESVPVS
jgi:hypothetical protein